MMDQDYCAAVAADVAARYGVSVVPSVVRCVPAGVSSQPLPVWDGRKLAYPEKVTPFRDAVRAHLRGRGALGPSAAVLQRQARLADLHAQGLTDAQLAEVLDVSIQTARDDRQALQLVSNTLLAQQAFQDQRRARVLDMIRRGLALPMIAAAEGISEDTVRRYAREHLGLHLPKTRKPRPDKAPKVPRGKALSAPPAKALPKPPDPVRVATLAAAVADLRAGHGLRATSARHGLSTKALRRAAGDMVLPKLPNMRPEVQAAQEERRARLMVLAPQGGTLADLAAALGVQKGTVLRDIAALEDQGKVVARPGIAQMRADAVERRRVEILQRIDAGQDRATIRADLNVSERTIARTLRLAGRPALGRAPKPAAAPRVVVDRKAAVLARQARLAGLVADGQRDRRALAAALGVPLATLRRDLRDTGLDVPPLPTVPLRVQAGQVSPAVAARRDRVLKMRQAGMLTAEIIAALGISRSSLTDDLRALDKAGLLDRRRIGGRSRSAKSPDISAQIIDFAKAGRSVAHIARQLCLSPKAVAKVLDASQVAA